MPSSRPTSRLRRCCTSILKTAAGALPKPQAITIAPNGLDPWREAVRIIQAHEIWQVYGRFVEEKHPRFGPGVAERMQAASKISAAEVYAARKVHAAASEQIRALLPPGTIVALPSAPCIAPRIDTPPEGMDRYRTRVMRLTCLAGLGSLPQVSIPAGTVAGCPAGLSFIGWAGGDEALLDLAVTLSRYCGFAASLTRRERCQANGSKLSGLFPRRPPCPGARTGCVRGKSYS